MNIKRQMGITFVGLKPTSVFCPYCGRELFLVNDDGMRFAATICGGCNTMVSYKYKEGYTHE